MGLDLVELVMECEEEFKLSIPDEDYQHLKTVGNMYEYVIRQKGDLIDQPVQPRVCLTMVTFARLRPALMSVADVSRRSISTMTLLNDLVPPLNRRADWERIQVATGLKLPALLRPLWMVCTLAAWAAGMSVAAIWLLTEIVPLMFAMVFVALVVLPILAISLEALSHDYAIVIPDRCSNVGGFSRSVLAVNYGTLQQKHYGWGDGDVWQTLQGIISEQLGVPLDEVTYEARFVEDLKAD